MPLTSITCNTALTLTIKEELARAVTEIFGRILRTSPEHNHVRIHDSEFILFAGSYDTAVTVQVKAADASISKEAREALVDEFSQVLTASIPELAPDRIYMVFEELPVQNIAVGTNIMRFATMHTAKSVDNISEVQP